MKGVYWSTWPNPKLRSNAAVCSLWHNALIVGIVGTSIRTPIATYFPKVPPLFLLSEHKLLGSHEYFCEILRFAWVISPRITSITRKNSLILVICWVFFYQRDFTDETDSLRSVKIDVLRFWCSEVLMFWGSEVLKFWWNSFPADFPLDRYGCTARASSIHRNSPAERFII